MAARTRLYTISGMTTPLCREGWEEMVERLRLMVILPEREIEARRPEGSLDSKADVTGLYRARE
jgi:hypothetical protein